MNLTASSALSPDQSEHARRRVKSPSLLHHSVALSATRQPQAMAFVHDDRQISFEQLFDRMCSMSQLLVNQGIQRGDRVGLLCAKGIDTSVAMYGAMAAGGAYVPLDPQMPVARLRRIIADCHIRVFVCDTLRFKVLSKALAENRADGGSTPESGAGHSTHTDSNDVALVIGNELDVDVADQHITILDWATVDATPHRGLPDRIVLPSDLAYIMYTSGSTGVPKGLMHTHASGCAYARLSVDLYDLTPADRLANMAPLHFDMSTLEYLAAPLAGACTIIVSEELARFPASVTELIEREQITIWYSVPHAMVQMLHYGAMDQRDLLTLRYILLGGERVPVDDVRVMMEQLPHTRFVNVYGPAEVNQCTHYELPRPLAADLDSVPIGRPWPETEALIVDDELRPVADGETGELLIRTTTMMHGYWGRDDLNARVFVTLTDEGGFTRRYLRTGDLVVSNNTGDMVFLGRRDRQVKLRGYRIELDEIEAVINAHPGVEEVAVVLVKNSDQGGQLHARFTVVDSEAVDIRALRQRLAQRLPRYAVPSSVEAINAFPRTTSLKINRRQLAQNIDNQSQNRD